MAQEDRGPAPVPPPPLLDVRDLSVVARQRKQAALPIVADVSFELRPGEVIPLIGESGSGKTTLGRIIAGLMPARSGEVSFEGRSLGTSVGARNREELRASSPAASASGSTSPARSRLSPG